MESPLSKPLDELPSPLAVPPVRTPFRATVRPPGSKSLTNRALLLAALADGRSTLLSPLLEADDAQRMIAALRALGAAITSSPDGPCRIDGVGGAWRMPDSGLTLNLNNAGTATRFLAAAALLSPHPVTIDGNARMRQRPIGELAALLRALGAGCEFLAGGAPDCPPLRITPPPRDTIPHTAIDVSTTQSSQFISALLLIGPWLRNGITLRFTGAITSRSYVSMTLGLLQKLGAAVHAAEDLHVVRVGPGEQAQVGIRPFSYEVEPDASGATYFWAAAAMIPGASCTVLGLDDASLQGDAAFPNLLRDMGADVRRATNPAGLRVTGPSRLAPITCDMADMPDAAMSLASVAAFAPGPTTIRGLGTLRVKETDRIAAMQAELAKVGVTVRQAGPDPDAITVTPPSGGLDCSPSAPRVEFDTYDDHRMAMSLALIGLRRPNVFIRDPRCVAKTYPTFWRDLDSLYRR